MTDMTEREKFEKFALSKEWSIQRKNEGYLWESVQAAWETWQARAEAVCPYIVTAPGDDVGGVGTSYCSLAEAKRPEVANGEFVIKLRLLRERIDVERDSRYDSQMLRLIDILIEEAIPAPAEPARIKSKDGGGK